MWVPVKRDRTSKPPLGTPLRSDGHWSVDRLAVCVMLNEGAGGTVYDCASGRNCSATFPGWWNSSFGTSLKFFNYEPQYVDCGPLLSQSSLQEITVETLVLSEDNVGARMIAEDGSAHNANSFYLAQIDGKFEFEVFGTGYSIVTSASYQVDKWAHVVGTWTAGQPPSIYVNGSMSNESYLGSPQSSLINGDRNLTLGVRPTAASLPYLGNIGFFKLYRSALNPQQIASLSANPWQIYEPETVWVEAGGGRGVFEGSFGLLLDNLVHSASGQIGCGGGISASAGAATYAGAGVEGKQGLLLLNTAGLVHALSGSVGNSATINFSLSDILQSALGATGASGAISTSISAGSDMAGKLGVSATMAAALNDMGCFLMEVVIGGKIHRVVISTKTGKAVILTATGHINITTN